MTRLANGRIVVVSPHSDDAVFSLAATIAREVESGNRVEVLTVFGLDPASTGPTNGWDRRGGFATEGAAARGRRSEDRSACEIVGAKPSWLPFHGGGYAAERPTEAIWSAIERALEGADAVVVPGFPLTNPDHAWLTELLTTRPIPCARLGVYVEQPYRHMSRKTPVALGTPSVAHRNGDGADWVSYRPGVKHYLLKRRAIAAYASQLPLLGYARRPWSIDRMLLHEAWHGGEAVAWLSPSASDGSSSPS